MANDYGYFGNGSTGYAHYKQSFDRNFGGSGGSGGNRNSGGKWFRLWASVAHRSCYRSRVAGIVGDVTLRDSKHCQHYRKALLTRTACLRRR